MTHWRKRLIEDSLPLRAISAQAAREKSIRHGHISTLHIWWARRPLVACRAAIFAALASAPKDEAERRELHDFLQELCTWEASNDPRIIEKARKYIRKQYPDAPPKVLDMFAGGGAIPLEAQRLGCESHAIDLNPVAHLIELCTLVYPQKYGLGPDTETKRKQGLTFGESACQLADDVRKWGKWVLEEAKKEIGHLYPKVDGKTPVAYLWARTVKCPNPACGATVPLLKQTWLRKKKGKNIALSMVPIPEEKRVAFNKVEGAKADGSQGTMDRNSSTCPCCKTTISNDYLENEGKSKRFGQQLLAIVCQSNGAGKEYLEALPEEEKRLEQMEKELEERLKDWAEEGLTVPDEELPYLRSIFNVKVYGTDRWGELFGDCQVKVQQVCK